MSKNKMTIIVDSASDMLLEEAVQHDIILLPLTVRFGDEEFLDGVTITRDEFYNRLTADKVIPKTSCISPSKYGDIFNSETAAGNSVICLVLSSDMSGCYQSASIAAEEYDNVYVIDTRQFCGPEYLLALRAASLRDNGLSAEEIVDIIEVEKEQVKVIALLDTLEYLKIGGRISPTAAGIGNMLSIKPVISIENGLVSVLGKARGSKKGNNMLMKFVEDQHGIDYDKPFLLSYSGNSRDLLDRYIDDSASLYPNMSKEDLPVSRVGTTIGTYTGPGAIALSFFPAG